MKKFSICFVVLTLSCLTTLAQQRICPACNGYKGWSCTACYGYGFIWVPVQTPYGMQQQKIKCRSCAGYGVIVCKTCKGYGVLYSTRSNPSFGGRKYDCERCLCPKYSRKSTFNSDCKNCGDPKNWHYSQK